MQWQLFGSTFALIFISELPDKTAFATLLLASRADPLAVFCGAAGAFVVQSAVAVAFGRLLSLLPERMIHIGAGIVFLVLAVLMWRRKEPAEHAAVGAQKREFKSTVLSAFLVIFFAEWGDLTQLATATLSAKYAAPFTIFVSATLALWAVTGLSAIVGHLARRVVQPAFLQKIAAVTFALVGAVLLIK